jgi:hypothetical protein
MPWWGWLIIGLVFGGVVGFAIALLYVGRGMFG